MQSVLLCKKDYVIIKLADEKKDATVPGVTEKVKVQKNVDVSSSGINSSSKNVEVSSGSQLTDKLKSEGRAQVGYLGLSVNVGGGYSYETTVNRFSMYALMAINQFQFFTSLSVPRGRERDSLNPEFLAEVQKLPPWEESNDVKQRYLDFFNSWGTHVIQRCYYGCRYILQVETNNAALKDQTEYKAFVEAEFGRNFGTSGRITKEKAYKEYQSQRRTTASVVGGDQVNSLKLQRDPGKEELFDGWAESIENVENSAVTGVEAKTFGQLLNECRMSQGSHITDALKYFTRADGPKPITVNGYLYTTQPKGKTHLEIQCWGEGVENFEIDSLDGGKRERNASNPAVMNLWKGPGSKGFTAKLKIHGETRKPVHVGVYHRDGSHGIHLTLLPPTGPIQIDFTKNEGWNKASIPSLNPTGNQSPVDVSLADLGSTE